jgi:hypothetical protein
VERRDVLTYFGELRKALTQMQTPAQLLNVGPSGFCSRPEKAKKRKIVYRSDCPVKPGFREHTDTNHISLVATISLSGEALKPIFMTTSAPSFTDPIL